MKTEKRIISLLSVIVLSLLFIFTNPISAKANTKSDSTSVPPYYSNLYCFTNYYNLRYPVCWSSWKRSNLPSTTSISSSTCSYTLEDFSIFDFNVIESLDSMYTAEHTKISTSEFLLNGLLNGEYYSYVYYIYLDHGFFTDYCDTFKSLGWIDPSYQLPSTYYKCTLIGTDEYTAECPEIATYNAFPIQAARPNIYHPYPLGQPYDKAEF